MIKSQKWTKRFTRMKRNIFMASLFLSFTPGKDSGKDDLKQCNDELKLVHDVEALKLPSAMRKMVWSDTRTIESAKESMSVGRIDTAVETVWTKMPRWLKYSGIKEDIEEVLRHVLRIELKG